MKRVLLFTESLGSGGAERQLTGLAVLLKHSGVQVKVLTYYKRMFYEEVLKDNGIQYELDSSILCKFSGLFHLSKDIKSFNPDTVISFLPSPNKRMCIIRLFCRFRLIVSERSHTQHWNIGSITKYLMYAMADNVVTNSLSELNNIALHCPWLKKKSCVISNYVDSEKFQPSAGEKSISNKFLSVGRLIPSKNVLRLLDAIFEIRQKGVRINLTWVGAQYDKSYLALVQSKIKDLALNDCVVLKDQTSEMLKEYHNADFFCLPSLIEGYPNVLVEAMSCGLPVICSNVCEMPNIVDDGVNGFLFNPMDTNDIVDSVMRMMNLDKNDYMAMSKRNRQIILKNNSKDIFVRRYLSII